MKLSAEERERLDTLIHSGKHPARKLTRARVLLKADVGEAGEGWSDSRIAAALDIAPSNVARIRQQLVEEGVDSVLTPKRSPASSRRPMSRPKPCGCQAVTSSRAGGWGSLVEIGRAHV